MSHTPQENIDRTSISLNIITTNVRTLTDDVLNIVSNGITTHEKSVIPDTPESIPSISLGSQQSGHCSFNSIDFDVVGDVINVKAPYTAVSKVTAELYDANTYRLDTDDPVIKLSGLAFVDIDSPDPIKILVNGEQISQDNIILIRNSPSSIFRYNALFPANGLSGEVVLDIYIETNTGFISRQNVSVII